MNRQKALTIYSKKRRDNMKNKGLESLNTYVKTETKNKLKEIQELKGMGLIGEVIDDLISPKNIKKT